ncbi:MAG: hypothetical protein ACR2N2_09335 [Acidimicrobiia bacterium]
MDVQQEAQQVVGAYTASERLKMWSVFAFGFGATAVVAIAGGMIVGWIGTIEGVAALAAAAVLATATAGTLYDQSHRTRVSAAGLERGIDTDQNLYAAVPAARQRARVVSMVFIGVAGIAIAGILAFSFANAGTETDDDDKTEQQAPPPKGDDDDD